MNIKPTLVVFCLAGLLLISCQSTVETSSTPDPYSHITDQKVGDLLQKVIDKAGGYANWQNRKKWHYQKAFRLLDSLGNIENDVVQTHHYTFGNESIISIAWEKDSIQHEIIAQNGDVIKKENGKTVQPKNPQSLINTVLSSTFVIDVPFKLLDKGIVFQYLGLDTLEKGEVVEVLEAVFNPDANANHSTPDTWHLYFDKNDFRLLGYRVQHADHFSYVKNLRDTTVNGFMFPLERESYRVDSARNKLYLRADYRYWNFDLE